jgi:hypothetical protein
MVFIEKFRGLGDVKTLIENKTLESQTLEYKMPELLNDRNKICATISAFANSVGGLIIFGIEEDRTTRLPSKIKWVDLNSWNKERIQDIIIHNIQPLIDNIRIEIISNPENNLEGLIMVEVFESLRAPHQAPNRLYYRRIGNEDIPMPDDLIRDMMFKRQSPSLDAVFQAIKNGIVWGGNELSEELHIRLGLINDGKTIAKDIMAIFTFPKEWVVNCTRLIELDEYYGYQGHSFQYRDVMMSIHEGVTFFITDIKIKIPKGWESGIIYYWVAADHMKRKAEIIPVKIDKDKLILEINKAQTF